jgi:formamidopyrimidine-DNA glycosylase
LLVYLCEEEMPELPEVETMVRDLSSRIVGRTITDVDLPFPGEVSYPDPLEFQERVRGATITGIDRRAKYALFSLDSGDLLVVHRGMTGSLYLRDRDHPPDSHVRVAFDLDDGRQLRLNDPRKFGRVYLLDASGEERAFPWDRMGPEPLDVEFTAQVLEDRLRGRTALVKPLLLTQNVVAGLGNIYVDEALHLARIHPERRANTLDRDEIVRLHAAIVAVLGDAVERRGTTFDSYTDIEGRAGQFQNELRVFHRTGDPCPACGATIIKLVVGGRGTHICPDCQRK